MNREERRQRRQRDTKQATILFIIFLITIVLAVAGLVFVIGKFVIKDREEKPKQPVETQTEQPSEETEPPTAPVVDEAMTKAAEYVAGMTLEDKIAQMFVITPDALTGFSGVTAAGDTTKEWYGKRPVGGIVYLSDNLKATGADAYDASEYEYDRKGAYGTSGISVRG